MESAGQALRFAQHGYFDAKNSAVTVRYCANNGFPCTLTQIILRREFAGVFLRKEHRGKRWMLNLIINLRYLIDFVNCCCQSCYFCGLIHHFSRTVPTLVVFSMSSEQLEK